MRMYLGKGIWNVIAGYSWKQGKTALTILAILLLFNEAVATTLPVEKIEKARVRASNGEYAIIAIQDNTAVRLFKQDETGIIELSYHPTSSKIMRPMKQSASAGRHHLSEKGLKNWTCCPTLLQT